jgi:hypothetical protein
MPSSPMRAVAASSLSALKPTSVVRNAFIARQKIGLRQGVLRLLGSLGLSGLKGEWDTLYGERSHSGAWSRAKARY